MYINTMIIVTYMLALKSAFVGISVATNTRKQSAEVFVLWLHNQRYYTHDVIGIKMMYRDLPHYEGIRAKTHREYKLHENKHENHAIHNCRKWFITWSQFVLFTHSNQWLICHSMACTAIYSSHHSNIIKYGRPSQDCKSVKKTSHRSSSHYTYLVSFCCYSDYSAFPL